MALSPRSPLRSLASYLPPDRLILSPVQAGLYRSDAQTALAQLPGAVAFPVSAEEIVHLVRFCHEHEIPFVARGCGTGLCGACSPTSADSLVIVLQQMDRIVFIDPAERTATVQPGVTPARLDSEARLHGLRYLPNPGCNRSATLGGNLALDAAGPNAHLCGNTACQLLGATVVLPDGSAVECGGAPAFGGIGPDPLHLLPRSEGALGIVVELTLSLKPLAESQVMLTASFPGFPSALEAADSILFSGVLPVQLELFDARTWSAMTRLKAPDPAPILWCTLEGPTEQTKEEVRIVADLIQNAGALRIDPVPESPARENLLKQRDGLFSSLGSVLVEDGVVPRSHLAEALRFLDQLGREEDIAPLLSINAATGNLFPAFPFDHAHLESFRQAERAAIRFLLHCAESGGSITGCHGLGREKRGLIASVLPEEEIRFEQALRAVFHPGAPPPDAPSVTLFPPLPGETLNLSSR